ncbi:MAG: TolC family protein [Candidatus Glassbacteria bacterium]
MKKRCRAFRLGYHLVAALVLTAFNAAPGMGTGLEGQTVTEEALSLKLLVSEAVAKNPEINALRELEAAKAAFVPQVYSLPDPIVSYSLRNVGTDRITVGEEMMAGRTLSLFQKVPFPGKLGLKKDAARWDEAASSHLTEERSLSVVAAVKMAYYDLYFTYEAIDVINEIEGILGMFLKTAEARYKVGKGIQQDVLKAQVELSRLHEQKVLLEERKAVLKDLLNKLVGREPDSPLGRPLEIALSPLPETPAELEKIAQQKSPTLQLQDALAAREESSLSLAKKEYFPDISLSMAWMERGLLEDIWEVRLGLEIPLYFWSKEMKGVEEAESRYMKAKYEVEDVRLTILRKVRDLYVELDTSERLHNLYANTIVPQAKLALESSRRGYETGEVDFLTLFDNLVVLLNYKLEAIAQLVRHENKLAELESIIGEELSYNETEE